MSLLQIGDQLCRICSKSSTKIVILNEIVNGRSLTEMLIYCATIEVFEGDDLPFQCCVDCKFDLIVAYNLVVRCKESDAFFRSQLTDRKDAIPLLSYGSNNATNVNQLKTEFKKENECVFAEPICDLYVSTDEQPNILLRNESEGFNSDHDANNDDKVGGGLQEDDSEKNLESNVDDSDADEIVYQTKRSRYAKEESSSSPKRCCKCKTRLKNKEQVEQHSKIHIESRIFDEQITAARPFECLVCFNRYTKKRALLRHQREMYIVKQFQCDQCGKEFLTESQLADHKESHDKDSSGRKKQLTKCCACPQQFESEELLRKHADEIHLLESQSSTNDIEKKFICDICHRRYKTKRTLLEHKTRPYLKEQNMCTQCGKMFREKRFLIDHERCHQGDRPLVCPVCSKTFAIKDSYRKHVKSHSIEKDRFKCEICSKGFMTKMNLKSHYITHRTDYRPMSCSFCSASFARKATLKLHMRLHTGEKPHKCNMCDASFACPGNLKKHIMAHKGIKPYICNVCERGYPRQDYLRKHMISHIASHAGVPAVWAEGDEKARATILLLLEDNQFGVIRAAKTAKEAWAALAKHHQKVTLSTRVSLLKRMCETRYTEGEDMEDYLSKMENLYTRLCSAGKDLGEDTMVAFILRGLPKSFDALTTVLETRADDALTLNLIREKLLDEQNKPNRDVKGESALKSVKRKTIKCHFCKKPGHKQRDCRLQKEQAAPKKQNANAAQDGCSGNMFALTVGCSANDWIIDSGASSHMTSNKDFFDGLKPAEGKVQLADGRVVAVAAAGNGVIKCTDDSGNINQIRLVHVLYVPKLSASLMSVHTMTTRKAKIQFDEYTCKITVGGKIIATATKHRGLYLLNKVEQEITSKATVSHTRECQHTWHRRFGHRDPDALEVLMKKNLVTGMKIADCGVLEGCECCLKGKQARTPFPKTSEKKTNAPLDLVLSDVYGPLEVSSRIRSDRGGEYSSEALLAFYREKGIHPEFTAGYSPQQNGVAERRNRYIIEMCRCMLIDARMPARLWAEAAATTVYLQNYLPSRAVNSTPYEHWWGRKPDVSHLRVFGCKAFVHVPKEKRRKLDDKGNEMTFVGYSSNHKAYRFIDITTNKLVISRDVRFVEEEVVHPGQDLLNPEQVESVDEILQSLAPIKVVNRDIHQENVIEGITNPVRDETGDTPDDISDDETDEFDTCDEEIELRRSDRSTKGIPPIRYEDASNLAYGSEPRSYEEAINGAERASWTAAMKEELQSHQRNSTWTIGPLPKERKAVGSKWLYKRKLDEHGNFIRYKARLVAQGFSQKYGTDFDQVFAPVAKQVTFRFLLTIVTRRQLLVKHVDIKTAYLYGKLSETVYMRQPRGYETGGMNEVCHLKKSLYGLKQSGRIWNKTIDDCFKKLGFVQSIADACLYVKTKDNKHYFIHLYVDDMLIVCESEAEYEAILGALSKQFNTTPLGDVRQYLGIQVDRTSDGRCLLSQQCYIEKLASRFGLEKAKPSSIPMEPGYLQAKEENKLPNNDSFSSLVGGLLYIAVNTRPDVAISVSLLGRKVSSPDAADWAEAKRTMRYLLATKNFQLNLGDAKGGLKAYADADWAGDRRDCWRVPQRQGSGLILLYEDNQSAIRQLESEKLERRSKHVDTKFQFTKDLVQRERGIVENTKNNPGRNEKAMSLLQIGDQLCRICSKSSTKIISLNEIVNGRTLTEMLIYCVTIEVSEGDDLPFQCCIDCKFDLIVAYNFVIRCKESDAFFRSQLIDSKDAIPLLSYGSNNATNVNQLKTEFKKENEFVYAEPISDFYALNDEQSNMLLREESEGFNNDDDVNNDDKIGGGYMQEDDREDDNETNLESNVDDSDADEIVYKRKRSRYAKGKSSSSPKRCCKCKMRLKNIEQVEQHSKKHIESRIFDEQIIAARPFECSVCFKRFTTKRYLVRHQREMYIEKKFKCEECDKDFLSESQLADHKESHDKDSSGRKEKLTKCCACHQQFESEELLRKHADEIHLPESQTSTIDIEKKFICDICHRRYKTKRTLLDHKSKPYRNEQNMCSQCGKVFREKRFLIDHERLHRAERTLVCPICSKTFAIKDSYRKHVKWHSIEKDRFKCEVCNKGFKLKEGLKRHCITHKPDYRPISCSLCPATFARNVSLKYHMRVHTGEKPFKCNMCDASFACPSNLKQHIMAHKGLKPYICHICGKRYPRQDYLRRHMVSHNANN
ncbi:uncharacterized protein LOC129773335 [Toxorhynchites rutilus septentrionalis]|uniref:uncharacterized protein LOC129773335 n=1 Tax=Toxorhynchites rutilus septentrionalis TaxID=329112 RepID=UPI002478B2D5|nr:uncharacterized protein LOC129773335 [Toxorhynchites rutilus septentrionalis]